MKKTGLFVFAVSFILTTVVQMSFADETVTEKVVVKSKDAKRGFKKGAHRVGEALCVDGDIACAARKAENLIIEAGDAAVDGVSELKNKVD